MKYLIILISIFLISSCYEEGETVTVNPLLVNQCETDNDCQGEIKPSCWEVTDLDNNTTRLECAPEDCFGWTGKTGIDLTTSYHKDLERNCYKKILENQ
jgi:hypothetical protein